ADAEHASAAIHIEQDVVHARDVAFDVGDGRVTGRIDVDTRGSGPARVDLELDFTNLTRHFVDNLFGDEWSGNPGRYTGKFRFRAPLRGDRHATLAEASGSLSGNGVNGTLVSRIGLATKVLTVLRSTEALRMRFPTLQDQGIVFDTVRADLEMD